MPKLLFPQEIEVWYILPLIRKHLSIELIKMGLSQREVAKLMALTEPAISQYKKEKRAKENFFNQSFTKELNKSAKIIFKDKAKLYSEINRLNELVISTGFFCKLHQEKSSLNKKQLPCLNCKYK